MSAGASSPFPGMDPYLESRWSDVHAKLIGFIGEALQPLLPTALRARSEERVLLETLDDDPADRLAEYRADIAVVDSRRAVAAGGGATVVTVEPVVIRRYGGPIVDRFIQIIDVTSGNRVVTAIEILSPWNKGAGRLNRDYLRKLDDYGRGGVSVVEIDLLRHPPRGRLPVTEADIPADRRTPYVACVRRSWLPDEWRAYPMPLKDSLPTVPIPLRQSDAEVGLELQPLIARVYRAGGHDDIDYTQPPNPPLSGAEARWADELLHRMGKHQ